MESQTILQFGRGKCVFESAGGIPKKEQSKSTWEGVTLKPERFLMIDKIRKNHSLKSISIFTITSRFQEKLNSLSPIEYREKAAA
jgi:hypothetical protein